MFFSLLLLLISRHETSFSLLSYLCIEGKWPLERHVLMYTFSITGMLNFDMLNPLMNHSDVFEMSSFITCTILKKVIVSSLPMKRRQTKLIRH